MAQRNVKQSMSSRAGKMQHVKASQASGRLTCSTCFQTQVFVIVRCDDLEEFCCFYFEESISLLQKYHRVFIDACLLVALATNHEP